MNTMSQSPEKLWWVTPAKYVGPLAVVFFFVAVVVVAFFVVNGMINEAILTCVGAVAFLLVGIYDLLGELISIGRRIEDSAQSNSHKHEA
jgi:hypothetical protein